MRKHRRKLPFFLVAVAACWAGSAAAVTIRVDYSTDTSQFFGASNPQGAAAGLQAKAALDAAATFYSGILNDTLSSIQTPPKFFGSLGGEVTWSWRAEFPHPATGGTNVIPNMTIPANEYVVFVGARDLDANELGRGGPGGRDVPNPGQSGSFTPQEVNQVQQIHINFEDVVYTRGETSGFARWGGSLAIDNNSNWHFNHTTAPTGNKTDFYSVALHELAHTLGFGAAAEWNSLVSGTTFVGPEATAEYFQHGPVPLASATDKSHWSLSNTGSKVFNTSTSQQSLMSPALPPNTRRQLTNLDAAALVDIGWEINLPLPLPGDYNNNGVVDAADYNVWRNTLGSTTNLQANGDDTGSSAGVINLADYNFWKARYGQGAGGGAVAGNGSGSVPEPAGIVLLMVGGMLALRGASRPKPIGRPGCGPTRLGWAGWSHRRGHRRWPGFGNP